MKATRKNLVEHGIINSKLLSLMEFGDEIGYFVRIGSQRVQNMGHEFSQKEFIEAYDNYKNDSGALKLSDYKEIFEDTLLLKFWKINDRKYGCYIFNTFSKEFFERKIVKIKSRDNKTFIQNGGEFIEVNLENHET